MAPVLEKFTNLCALDLSCNSISVYQSDSTADVLQRLLSLLPHLIRLDLSSNRLKYRLRQLLTGIQKPLEHIRLAGCGLTEEDVRYLSQSHHTTAVECLDLSTNTLSDRSLGRLLEATRGTLSVLELEDIKLDDRGLESLLPSISQLQQLLFINLSHNTLSCSTGVQCAQTLTGLRQLQAVKYSYCSECYSTDDELDFEHQKNQFFSLVNNVIRKENENLHLIMVDLNT